MKNWNIILAGVGGQGLVTSTKIICDAAWKEGREIKSNDVIGLAQRGGKVWGSVRIGEKVYSPNIPNKSADILLGLEPLEALRWSHLLKDGGTVCINKSVVLPVPVTQEWEEYPSDIASTLKAKFKVIEVDANKIASELGNIKAANTVILGMISVEMDLSLEAWKYAIEKNVPVKFLDVNLEAFEKGREIAERA